MNTIDLTPVKNGEVMEFAGRNRDFLVGATLDTNKWGEFRIWFNGKFLWVGKTFKSFNRRFNELAEKWDLEIVTNEEE